MIKPPRLKPGSLIGLVTPASPVPDEAVLARGESALKELGFRVCRGRHVTDKLGYLAGTDQDRAEDLNEMFADPSVSGIFCVRGGYGAARLLDRLQFEPLKERPKVFLGYSDITALEMALLREIGLVTFYGPMVSTEMIKEFPPENRRRLMEALTQTTPPSPIGLVLDDPGIIIRPGMAEGILVGGCLSILVSLLGTSHAPPLEGAILFLEDIDEEPYRLDRHLTQLRLSGQLRRVAGIAVGQLVNCEPRRDRTSYVRSCSSSDVLRDRLGDLGVPVLARLGFGHGPHQATLPQGVPAVLDASGGVLKILESGVR
jgi:muramoyltetrapeptide carboxypeptidase